MFLTLESLHSNTLKELKQISSEVGVFPSGDKRCRQNWIDALVNTQLPLLRLLEASSGVETNLVQDAIAPAAKTSPGVETDSVQDAIASKFGRIVYPKPAANAIARAAETFPGVETSPGVETNSVSDAIAHLDEVHSSASITFSQKFLATYTPYFGLAHKIEPTGQLNLLELVETIEPPDPDDFDSMFAFWAAYDAWDKATETQQQQEGFSPFPPLEASFDTKTNLASEPTPGPLQVSLESFSQWAAIPDSWYESHLKAFQLLEVFPGSGIFSIPVFGDRQNGNGSDYPPDTGICVRLPRKPPPSFPPSVVASDRTNGTKKFACRSSIFVDGRAPPGGDVYSRN